MAGKNRGLLPKLAGRNESFSVPGYPGIMEVFRVYSEKNSYFVLELQNNTFDANFKDVQFHNESIRLLVVLETIYLEIQVGRCRFDTYLITKNHERIILFVHIINI